MSSRTPQSNSSPDRPPRPIQSKPDLTTSPARKPENDAAISGRPNVTVEGSTSEQGGSGSMAFPQQRRTGLSSAESTPSRALGVHSILNPTQPVPDEGRSQIPQQRSALPSLSPRTAFATTPVSDPSIPPRSRKRGDPFIQSENSPRLDSYRPDRRVLTPASPRARAVSLGRRNNPTTYSTGGATGPVPASGDGRHFYTAEPGQSNDSEIPPLPLAGLAARAGASHFPGSDPGRGSGRPAVSTYGYPLGLSSAIARPSESPNTSQSSYSNVSQTSPQFRYGAPQVSQSPYQSQQASQSNYQPGSHASGIGEAHYGMGQGHQYRMTLDTGHGPMTVPVELDLQQASKVADEKRKRNAGASARFRQRRKEKEKEASVTIASLEKDIRILEEERDYYFNERSFWRDFAVRTVGAAQLPPRPRSPAPRRQSLPMSSEGGSVHSQDQVPAGYEPATATQRRRTGDYQPSFTSVQPSASPMLPPQHPGQQQPYMTQGGGPLPPMQSPYDESRPGAAGQLPLPPNLAPASRSQSYDNLRPSNLFDRSWNPGR